MASHKFHNSDRLLLVYRSIQRDLTHGSRHIFCRAAVAWRMIRQDQVIVDSLRNTDKANVTSVMGCVAGKLADGIHGIIAANVQKITDLHPVEFVKNGLIKSIRQAFRKLIAAGTEIRRRSQLQKLQFRFRKTLSQVDRMILQHSLNAVDHSIHMVDFR